MKSILHVLRNFTHLSSFHSFRSIIQSIKISKSAIHFSNSFQTKQLIHDQSELCLSVGDPRNAKLFLDKCDGSANQMFTFTNIYTQDDFDF